MHATPGVRQARVELAALLAVGPGDRVLDVGCGPGDSTRGLATWLRPGGEAVGVAPGPSRDR